MNLSKDNSRKKMKSTPTKWLLAAAAMIDFRENDITDA